jgi:hypothetical protein
VEATDQCMMSDAALLRWMFRRTSSLFCTLGYIYDHIHYFSLDDIGFGSCGGSWISQFTNICAIAMESCTFPSVY